MSDTPFFLPHLPSPEEFKLLHHLDQLDQKHTLSYLCFRTLG